MRALAASMLLLLPPPLGAPDASPPPPAPPRCNRLEEDCPADPSRPEPFQHEQAADEMLRREKARGKAPRHGDPDRARQDSRLSDGWRELDNKIHGWRDGEFGEVTEPEGPWADGDEPPRDYHMCKKRYEDVWDISRVLHSLCAWWASGILCECVRPPPPPPPPALPAVLPPMASSG